MKTTLAVLLLAMVWALPAPAQNYYRMKEKARGLEGKINERDNAALNEPPPGAPPKNGAAPPSGQPAPAAAPAAPIKPGTQQQAATKLKADITAARAKGEVTAETKKQFIQDLQLAIMGSGHPSAATLEQFTNDFLPAVAAKKIAATEDAKLVRAIVLSLNSAGLSSSRTTEITGELETTLTKVGAPAADAAKAAQGLTAIMAEVQSAAIR